MPDVENFDDLRDKYADFFGRASALYNINPLLGRLYAYLLLSPQPMTLDDLVDTAGAAKSTVSVAMKGLEHYRLIRRQWKKGDRRDYFVARTDTLEVLRELYQQFFSREMKYMRDANNEARQWLSLPDMQGQGNWPTPEQTDKLLNRLQVLDDLVLTVQSILNQFLGTDETTPSQGKSIQIEVEE